MVYLAEYYHHQLLVDAAESGDEIIDINDILVAVRGRNIYTQEAFKDFDREANLLSIINHRNIVKLFGVFMDESPRKMIFEYMKNGDLKGFLM